MFQNKMVLWRVCLTVLAVVLGHGYTHAEQPSSQKNLGRCGDWYAFTGMEDGEMVCYMVSPAQKSHGKYKTRGDVYLVIAHRPSKKSFDVISHHAGYPINQSKGVVMTIKAKSGQKKVELFPEGEISWCPDDKTDREATHFLTKRGREIVVVGYSARGTRTTDTYSLNGSLRAYDKICKACGIKNAVAPKK